MSPKIKARFLVRSDGYQDLRSDRDNEFDRLSENEKRKHLLLMCQTLGEDIGSLLVFTCRTASEKEFHNLL